GGDRRPVPVGVLEDRRLAPGGALTLDLSGSFRSRDGSDLRFTATSSEPSVATASVDGSELTLRGLSDGGTQITVTATDGGGNSLNRRFWVTVASPPTAWLLPSASDPVQQGFVRVINHSGKAGEIAVTATDDAGVAYEPLALSIGAHATAHFNSEDLETGNAAKGLTGMTGPGTGGWRLVFESETLDVEALGYARTADGFVTSMAATARKDADGLLRLAIFNPASNTNQVSVLRLVNPSDLEASATVTGTDDLGGRPGSPVVLTVPPNAACEVDAMELESGQGLACGDPQSGLGDGAGKWRLSIESDAPLVAMGLLRSPSGHLSNLSGAAMADADGTWHVPLFPSASDPDGRQGFVRVASGSNRAGSVRIRAFDDSDVNYSGLSLRLGAGEAVQFNSDDLELGNHGKGLAGRTGSGTGAWRLALSGALIIIDFKANAYVRHRDGFLTAMQAVAPYVAAESPSTGRVHRVAIFNPGSNTRQVSVLRLVNRDTSDAVATITGADDRGVRFGSGVEVWVPANAAVELTAAELESGMAEAIESGALGDGAGKWRLRVASKGDLAVMSLLRSPTGHLTNLSGADEGRASALPSLPPPPASVLAEHAGGRRVRAEWSEV
ncbi:MAG: Ig-like domain-containing protein, partial [Gammaproteobacteria bacterium]|nr:Ig-like domain-containing protein [Gammaproteobacteria bacterium]